MWDMINQTLGLLLSWPVVAFAIALIFKGPLTRALSRLSRYKGFGQELEFGETLAALDVAQLEREVEVAGAEPASEGGAEPGRDDLARRAEAEPSYIILASWEALTRVVQDLAQAIENDGRRNPWNAMRTLAKAGVVNSEIESEYDSLRELRNQVAHGQHRPTPGEAITYAEVAQGQAARIMSLARHPSRAKVWNGGVPDRKGTDPTAR